MQVSQSNSKIEFDLKDYLEKNFGEVKAEIKDVRSEIKQVDENLKSEIKQVDSKVDKLMDNQLKHFQRYVLIGVSTITILLIKIVKPLINNWYKIILLTFEAKLLWQHHKIIKTPNPILSIS